MSASPFHGIFTALQDTAGQAQSPLAFGTDPGAMGNGLAASSVGRVAVDIYEQDDYYIIKAPIAGVRMTDIDIEVNDNVLTIRGERRQTDAQIPQNQYYLQECFWGPFARSVTLPVQIDPRKVRATFNKECILKILIPKEERVKIVKINEA